MGIVQIRLLRFNKFLFFEITMRLISRIVFFAYSLNIFLVPTHGGEWKQGLDKVKYEKTTEEEPPKNPQKGTEFSITTKFGANLGEVTFCTVEELFLNTDLHFSVPESKEEPNVVSVQNGRVELDQSDNKECAVIVKNASSSDDGTWHFKVGYGANLDMKYYEHKVIVKVKVDCEWGEWKTTVNCTDACGGKKHLEREQTQGAMHNGKQCETKPGHTQILKCCDGCKDNKCPDGGSDGDTAVISKANSGTTVSKSRGSNLQIAMVLFGILTTIKM